MGLGILSLPDTETPRLNALRLLAANPQNVVAGFRPVPVMDPANAPTLTWAQTATPSSVGLGQQWTIANSRVSLFGGIPTVNGSGYIINSRFFSNAGGAVTSPDYWQMEGLVTDSVCGIYLFAGATGSGIRVQVDGQLVDAAITKPASTGFNVLKLDFTAVGGLAPRRITVEGWGGNYQLIGLLTSATGQVAPTSPYPFKLMVLGDSVADGTGATWNGDGFPRPLAQLLGVADLRVSADGGTGFIAVTGSGKQNYVTRVADVVANTPDALVVPLSSNDYSQTSADLVAAVRNFISLVRVHFATMPIFLFGSFWNDGNLANAQTLEAAVHAAVTALGDPWLAFVPTKTVSGDTDPIWGQGTDTAPTGSGSSDWAWNGVALHPSLDGHFQIARFAAEKVCGAAAAMIP